MKISKIVQTNEDKETDINKKEITEDNTNVGDKNHDKNLVEEMPDKKAFLNNDSLELDIDEPAKAFIKEDIDHLELVKSEENELTDATIKLC